MNATRGVFAAVGVFLAASSAAIGLTASGAIPQPPHSCYLTQPVYAGTERVGSWNATLRTGQSVKLPDGDTATCTPADLTVN